MFSQIQARLGEASAQTQNSTYSDFLANNNNYTGISPNELNIYFPRQEEEPRQPSYVELLLFYNKWKDVKECSCNKERYPDNEYFEPHTSAHRVFLVSFFFFIYLFQKVS